MRPIILIVLGTGAAASALLLAGCHKSASSADPPKLPTATVRVLKAEARKHLATEDVVGTVRARLRANLEAKASGRIEQMLAVAGQAVKRGDVLAQLDVREIRARLDQASAARDQAERELKRYTSLLQQKTVTQAEYDAVEARYRIAAAAGTEAETLLGYARVTAPFDGVVTRKFADVGDLASPGRALVELEDPTALRLEADVPEALLSHIELGRKLPVRVTTFAHSLEGLVSEIAPVADPGSRTFLAKLDLPATPGLRSGQFGRVAVPTTESTILRVPASAVTVRGQMEIVFVVAGGKAHLRLVKTGKRLGDEVELVSGLEPGEVVVVDGAAALLDGQPVQIQP